MNYDNKELENGTRIEHEHTQDDALARKIATDHLKEDPHYYTKLQAAGLEEEGVEEEGALTPLEAGMEECDTCGCGDPSDSHEDIVSQLAPKASGAVVMIGGEQQAAQSPLSSSNLGKGGVNKPLKSDNLEAPEAKKVGANKVASTKTPPLGGGSSITTDSASDPMDHFGSAIVGLAEGGSQIKKK